MSKSKSQNPEGAELLTEIASFASSLGLSSAPSSGFNDRDFRKPEKPQNPAKAQKPARGDDKSERPKFEKKFNHAKNQDAPAGNKNNPKPQPKAPILSIDHGFQKESSKFKDLPALPLVKASSLGLWYEDAMELEKKVFGDEGKAKKKVEVRNVEEWKRVVERKREMGERLMWQYTKDYESSRGKSGDMKMVMASQRSGTAADKISAFSFMIADNPVATMRSFDGLLGMVTSKVGKRFAFTGFESLRELFITKLLPDRKLKTLLQCPLNELPDTKDGHSLLLFWYWEDCLKQRYERFVISLEEASRDMLPALKDKALKTMYVLLKSKPEQERRLLSALVNKLGDPQNKGASNADFYLSNLLSEHPSMKAVVIDEVDTFLFRPHLGPRAKYHAVNFLCQTRLSNRGDGPKVAKRLIDVYFALFKVLITEASASNQTEKNNRKNDWKKENKPKDVDESHVELDSRLLSALLTGVNRAFPYVSNNEVDDVIEKQTPMLFKLVHSKNFNVGVQALMLLDKISSKSQVVSERFYRALYSKLLLPAAMNSSKAEMFIGLLMRSMRSDVNLKRVAAFAKRLLQVALQQPPQYACGCLFLLSEVLKARPQLWNMVLQNESVDDELEHFEDIVEDADNEPTGIPKKEENNAALHDDDAHTASDPSDDEAHLQASFSEDDGSDDADELLPRRGTKDLQKPKTLPKINDQPQASLKKSSLPGGYDPRHREPSYCNADRASWWELMVLATHVHPSVATMAATLLSGANIVYNGNPLHDLSLPAFLDKFMEKKAKTSTWHGGSQIEPAKKLEMNHHLIGPEILSLAESDVPPEDLVFHKFYVNKMTASKKPKKKKKKKSTEDEAADELLGDDGSDGIDGGDESDNEEIDNILDSSNPSMEADGEYDYDDLDKIADEDDDLVDDDSDAEMDVLSDIAEGDEEDGDDDDEEDGDDDDAIGIEDVGDISEEEEDLLPAKRRRKSGKKPNASPFASYEEYEHLLKEDSPQEDEEGEETETKTKKHKRHKKSKKKKKSSG